VTVITAGWTSDDAFCALALDPIASIKKPMTADAARPPRSFTTMYLCLCWREKNPLEALL
jgi:hypothetical protein